MAGASTPHPARSARSGSSVRAARAARPWALLVSLVALAGGAAALATATQGSPHPATGTVAGTSVRHGDTVATVSRLGPTSFVRPGPFAAGETTLTLPGDGAKVEVWYPARPSSTAGHRPARYNLEDWLPTVLKAKIPKGFSVTYPTGAYRGVPVAAGRFPLVVFSHGFSGYRDQSTFLTSRLATWGFVVAAPDLLDSDLTAVLQLHLASSTAPDVGEVRATITLMAAEDHHRGSPLAGRLDLTRIAAIGHSLGGEVSEQVALADPRVTTFIGMAGASAGALAKGRAGAMVPDKPGMLMTGTRDRIVPPRGIVRAYRLMVPPKRLVVLRGAGHLIFSDICELAPGQGGLVAVAGKVGIALPGFLKLLATDGCQKTDLAPSAGWPVIRQAVTAQLRHVFGFDRSDAGLAGLVGAFPGATEADVASRR